jgi:hypothetical protein
VGREMLEHPTRKSMADRMLAIMRFLNFINTPKVF